MARSGRVAESPFGQFMASTAGRITRGLVGIALIVVGFVLGGVAGGSLQQSGLSWYWQACLTSV